MDDVRDILQAIVDLVNYEDGTGPIVYAYVRGELEEVYVSEDLAYLLTEAYELLNDEE